MSKIVNFAAIAVAHLAMTFAAIYLSVDYGLSRFGTSAPPSAAERLSDALVYVLGTPVLMGAYLADVSLFTGWNFEILAVANSLVWAAAITWAWNVSSRRVIRRHIPVFAA